MYTPLITPEQQSTPVWFPDEQQIYRSKYIPDHIFVVIQDVMTKVQFGIYPLALLINVVNISVFLKMGVKDVMTLSLLSLTISDFLSLSIGSTLITIDFMDRSSLASRVERYVDLSSLYRWVLSLTLITQSTSTNITTLIALERCLLVPFKLKSIVTMKRTAVAILCIVVFGVMVNLPNFLTSRFLYVFNPRLNVTRVEVRVLKGRRIAEEISTGALHMIIYPISLIIVVTSNIIMIRGLRQAAKVRVGRGARPVKQAGHTETPDIGRQPSPTMTPKASFDQQAITKDTVDDKMYDNTNMVLETSAIEVIRNNDHSDVNTSNINHSRGGISGKDNTDIATNSNSSSSSNKNIPNETMSSNGTNHNIIDDERVNKRSDGKTNDNYNKGIIDVITSEDNHNSINTNQAKGPKDQSTAVTTSASEATRPRQVLSKTNIRLVNMLLVVASITAVFHVIAIFIGLWIVFERELAPDGYYSNGFFLLTKCAQFYFVFTRSINIAVYIKFNLKFRNTLLAMCPAFFTRCRPTTYD
ncbi:chemosensory receptor C [Elysia marginata]|uniref:Chemosensory receptor C n=1 Tax=Elysia marginata TaxID=1093978 RepID=A0AAV4IL70_9GAST|nr:chemosensory receptor C [Elysia marginata]